MRFPTVENKVNWTTVIAAFGVCATIGAWIYSHGQFTQRMDSNENTQSAMNVRTEARIERILEDMKRLDNLAYRVTLVEQNNITLTQNLTEISKALSSQGADIRVIREILDRSAPTARP